MNTELVESLVQVIQTLPPAEQSMLKQQLTHADQPAIARSQSPITRHSAILSPLIQSGRIIPPSQPTNSINISELEFRAIVSQIQISGTPISETVIEDRGEW
jgi:hypothetical protein